MLREFAELHKLRLRRDSWGDLIVPGRRVRDGKRKEDCCHVFDGIANGLGVCFMFTGAKKWGFVRRALEATGARLRQDGHTEGSFVFDPSNPNQTDAVIRLAGLKKVRVASTAQLAVL